MRLMRMLLWTLTPPNRLTPPSTAWVTLNHRLKKPSTTCLNRHLPFGFCVPNIEKHVNKRGWTCLGFIGVPPIAPSGRVSLILHAMTLIGALRESLRVVSLRVATRLAVVIRVVVVIGVVALRAIKEGKRHRTGADVGRSAQRGPLRKKKPSGTPVTLPWPSFHRES